MKILSKLGIMVNFLNLIVCIHAHAYTKPYGSHYM